MKHFFSNLLFFCFLSFLTSCASDDDTGTVLTGKAQFEITDGPAEDANIKSTFVTIADVKIDGESISGFSGKQTIDLMAYQNGNTQALGIAELKSGTYNNVGLVLDYETDADGNSPGCYVLTTDNVKHDLTATAESSQEIVLTNNDFQIEENSTVNLAIDFDLRKSLKYEEAPQSDDEYDFVTQAELNAALRLANKSNTGSLMGEVNDDLNVAGETIVVYAYKKGEFNKASEINGQGESQIEFKNAVTSATVDASGNYTLAFLNKGEYELHFFSYTDDGQDGRMELEGELELNLLGSLGIDLNSITVESNATLTVNVEVIGFLP